MARRIMAWIMIVGFFLLIMNISIIGYQWQLSVAIYLVIVFGFLFTNKKDKTYQNKGMDVDKNDNTTNTVRLNEISEDDSNDKNEENINRDHQ